MNRKFKTLAATAFLSAGAIVVQSLPAEAQSRGAAYRVVPVGTNRVIGYIPRAPVAYRPALAARRAASPYFGLRGGYRPAVYSPYRYGYYPTRYRSYPRYGYGYYRRGYSTGGALAAGLIGGLALGALTSPYVYSPAYYPGYDGYGASYYPSSSYGYPSSYPYYGASYYGAPAVTCFFERRRVVDRFGRLVWRRAQVCY